MSDYFYSRWEDEVGRPFTERVNEVRSQSAQAQEQFNEAVKKVKQQLNALKAPL